MSRQLIHRELDEYIKYGEDLAARRNSHGLLCSCGKLIKKGFGTIYYLFGNDLICNDCLDSYIKNYISSHTVEA